MPGRRESSARTSVFSRPTLSRRLPMVPVLSSEARMPFPGDVRREAISRNPELSPFSISLLRLERYLDYHWRQPAQKMCKDSPQDCGDLGLS